VHGGNYNRLKKGGTAVQQSMTHEKRTRRAEKRPQSNDKKQQVGRRGKMTKSRKRPRPRRWGRCKKKRTTTLNSPTRGAVEPDQGGDPKKMNGERRSKPDAGRGEKNSDRRGLTFLFLGGGRRKK